MNSKLHAVCDGKGRPVILLLTPENTSDIKAAYRMIDVLPEARELIADRGYDADRFRKELENRNITPCIPGRRNRKVPVQHDRKLYQKRHIIENMFAKLKDWRRIATRYDRCAHTFFSSIIIAATIIFWMPN